MDEVLEKTTPENEQPLSVEELVKGMFEKGLEADEISNTLQKMYEEQKLSEEDLNKGLELIKSMDKELASKQFGVDIL